MTNAQNSGTVEREWTLWLEQRAPNERGSYRYRATFPFLGLTVTAEWTEEMHLCGMGYGDSEWWPLSSCHWNGYQRYITHKGLEWSPILEDDPDDIVWSGLDLLPCPFTGKPAKLKPQGQFIGAPLWRSEAVWISSAGVPQRRWTDAKAMRAAWNTRSTPAPSDQAGWQDIATAPFNELVWCFEPHNMGGFMFAGGKNNGGSWYNNLDDKRQYPTHWMPLPTAPTLTAGEGGGEHE